MADKKRYMLVWDRHIEGVDESVRCDKIITAKDTDDACYRLRKLEVGGQCEDIHILTCKLQD